MPEKADPVSALREALIEYGAHHIGCRTLRTQDEGACNCGLMDEILALSRLQRWGLSGGQMYPYSDGAWVRYDAIAESRPLKVVGGPRAVCPKCGNELLGEGTLSHHDDGSHTFARATLSGEAPDRDGEIERIAAVLGPAMETAYEEARYVVVCDVAHGPEGCPDARTYPYRLAAAALYDAGLRAPSLEGARPTYTVVETLQSPDTPPSDLHLRGARHPEAGETT